jgi:hypothetical protein
MRLRSTPNSPRYVSVARALLFASISLPALAQSGNAFLEAPAARVRVDAAQATPYRTASRFDKYIAPGEAAPKIGVGDKMILGIRDAFSPTSIAVWPLVAGYEQATNGSPNWPQKTSGYFRRLLAAGARDSSEGIFSDSVFSPIFHQDPRYYKVGHRRGKIYRTFYAISRPLITRTDSGRAAPNLSTIGGNFFGSWLTDAYYPTANQGFEQNAKTFGGSMGSSALGCFVAEFADGFLETIHLKQRQ